MVAQLPACSSQYLPHPTQSYPEAPPYLIGVFHPGDPAVRVILLPVAFFCRHHQGQREGIPASVQAPRVWWILPDSANFTLLFYEIPGMGARVSQVLVMHHTHKPYRTSSSRCHFPPHARPLTLEALLWPQPGLPQATAEPYCWDSGCSCWREEEMRDTSLSVWRGFCTRGRWRKGCDSHAALLTTS